MLRKVIRRFSNYYELLQVPYDANANQIKKAYYDLAKKYHPDTQSSDPDKFKEINEAYATLIDPDRRQQYDSNLSKGQHTKVDPAQEQEFSKSAKDFNMDQTDYHEFWKKTKDSNYKNLYEQRRQEYLRNYREKTFDDSNPIYHKMKWDDSKDLNFGVFILCSVMFMVFLTVSTYFPSKLDKKMNRKIEEELNKIMTQTNKKKNDQYKDFIALDGKSYSD